MIGSVTAAARVLERAPDPAFGSPSERHDAGWLGQVPPPPTPSDEQPRSHRDAPAGYDPSRDAHDGGWLGQVPPPTPPADEPASTEQSPVTGYDRSRDAHDGGWLGQVPPPSVTEPTPQPSEETPYAVPHLAPEPWKTEPPRPGVDPTLFG